MVTKVAFLPAVEEGSDFSMSLPTFFLFGFFLGGGSSGICTQGFTLSRQVLTLLPEPLL
jgi:hypothetical protein